MASIVASSSSTNHVSQIQGKGSRNKRKFRADPQPQTTIVSPLEDECLTYEFSAEKFDNHGHLNDCDMCSFSHDNAESIKLALGLSDDVNDDADWSDLTESQLEELVLANLDAMFKTAIKKLVMYGYTEEAVIKAVLRCGFCCGCKDIVSDVMENTLIILKNEQRVDQWKNVQFDSLQQMEKYILAEMVCVVREVRPFLSIADAMWRLLISDMNVSQACAMNGEDLISTNSDGASNSVGTEIKKEAHVMTSASCVHNCKSDAPVKAEVHNAKPSSSFVSASACKPMSRSLSLSSQNHDEKPVGRRKIKSSSKRDYMLRQKSVNLEKRYRTYGLKGGSRSGKLNGLTSDTKLKSVSQCTSISPKNVQVSSTSTETKTRVKPCATQTRPNFPLVLSTETKAGIKRMLGTTDIPSGLSVTETELSLSLPVKSNNLSIPEVPNIRFSAMPKSTEWSTIQDKKDETISKFTPRVDELKNQLQQWTEWANQKVMQAARRLGKDKTELKILRQEKEEVERLKKEKKTLEDNTMNKLSEMENALKKASYQVGRASGAMCRLEAENANLRVEMEAAKLQVAESAASCQEVVKREKKTLMQLQTWEKEKTVYQDELTAEKRKISQLQEDLEQAKEQRDQLETKWKQEEKAKQDLINQATKIRIERQESEVLAKSREDLTRLKADKNLQKYKDDIIKLEKQISLIRECSDSSKIAALRKGIDGSYASKLTDIKTSISPQTHVAVKRERECVMCLSEEISVVFLPCAHQVVCTKCNELHEKQGMKECPSCRGPIQRRICVRYARC
ncbi:putative E3 ubiquitin-protein ligase RF298 [Rutidosis leptorrhynchoides]|uniref:putative E3 ubiquitin-protein ligase RF298 n=1 Tax=Rutidosis leptorrhynchoides TaxID=125765 RepID=UPI003A99958C